MARPTAESLAALLRSAGLIGAADSIRLEEAGDGNINWVRRVRVDGGRSFVVKHAGDTLERFPEYAADPIRLRFEAEYMAVARRCDRDGVLPRLLHFEPAASLLVLEDLGAAARMDAALLRGDIIEAPLATLATFLGRVHAATAGDALQGRFENAQMRRLHGDHIFHLPFRRNDFPLAPSLRATAASIWNDAELRGLADAAYARYLEPRGALVHADVQGSNILLTRTGPKLLDAEIAHIGDPAFDVGTLLAHVLLPAVARGNDQTVHRTGAALWHAYAEAHANGGPAFADAARYAGIEMLRRTIGAARVTAAADAEAALAILARAVEWIRHPPAAPD
jgi:5-methylthioribose kinase